MLKYTSATIKRVEVYFCMYEVRFNSQYWNIMELVEQGYIVVDVGADWIKCIA